MGRRIGIWRDAERAPSSVCVGNGFIRSKAPDDHHSSMNGTIPRIARRPREWACSFRLCQQLFPHKQFRNGLVFMAIPPDLNIKAVSYGGFANGMSKPIPYSFVQPDTIQRTTSKSSPFGMHKCIPYAKSGALPSDEPGCLSERAERINAFPTQKNIFSVQYPR